MRKRLRKQNISQSPHFRIPLSFAPIFSSHDEPYHGPGRGTFEPEQIVTDGGNSAEEIPNTRHAVKFHLLCYTTLTGKHSLHVVSVINIKLWLCYRAAVYYFFRFINAGYTRVMRKMPLEDCFLVRHKARSVIGTRQCSLGCRPP